MNVGTPFEVVMHCKLPAPTAGSTVTGLIDAGEVRNTAFLATILDPWLAVETGGVDAPGPSGCSSS